jgi:hypothetical protein
MRQNSVKEYDPSAGDVYFYLCERAIDPLTPIMHDFYYQSLLYDLMDITDDRLELTYKVSVFFFVFSIYLIMPIFIYNFPPTMVN